MSKENSFTTKAAREQKALNWFITSKPLEEITSTPTFNQYDHFDSHLISGGTNYLTEVKVRTDYTYEQIEKFGGSFLEFTKIEGIRQYKELNQRNDSILYFNFYKDCLVIYEVSDYLPNYDWQMKWLQKNDYDKTMIWKWVTCLRKENIIEIIKYK